MQAEEDLATFCQISRSVGTFHAKGICMPTVMKGQIFWQDQLPPHVELQLSTPPALE